MGYCGGDFVVIVSSFTLCEVRAQVLIVGAWGISGLDFFYFCCCCCKKQRKVEVGGS
jgi:hypothetical protein